MVSQSLVFFAPLCSVLLGDFWKLDRTLVGSGLFLLLLAVRAVLGTLRGALVATILTPILALCYTGTTLYWSPCIFFRACKGLRGEFRSTCLLTLLLLPLRAPVVLVLSLVLIFLLTFFWIVFATLIYEEETEECKNLLLGGLIAVGPFSGVLQFLPKITMDWWRDLHRNYTRAIWSSTWQVLFKNDPWMPMMGNSIQTPCDLQNLSKLRCKHTNRDHN